MIKKLFYFLLIIVLGIGVGILVYLFYPGGESGETMKIKVFFSNHYEDPSSLHCDQVYFAERRVKKTQVPAYTALEELLKGPNKTEEEAGFFTNINKGVEVQSFKIENGKAMVDFNERLGEEVAGSCRVQAIRSQIIETLRQFPEINEVIISIGGKTEGILQP